MIFNMPPKLFTLSAVVVGYLLIDDMTSNEQNAIGNWLMLVAQVLCTNAYFKNVVQDKNSYNNKKEYKNEKDETIELLKKMINALEKEVEQIKKL